jgi:hypothetical protein
LKCLKFRGFLSTRKKEDIIMMKVKHLIFVVSVFLILQWSLPPTSLGINFTVNNNLGDLDASGNGNGEAAVVQAAVNCWQARVTTNRPFTVTQSFNPERRPRDKW